MAKEPKSYGTPLRENRSRHESAWSNPRDDDRTPETRDPNMDRNAIGSNNPDYRSK